MKATVDARNKIKKGDEPLPLLVKVAPDLTEQEKKDIADAAIQAGVDGLIVSNTTSTAPTRCRASTRARAAASGAPCAAVPAPS